MIRTFLILCLAASLSGAQDAKALFDQHCASCHRPGSETRAPLPAALKLLSKERILGVMELGSMMAQAATLSSAERLALAAHLSGGSTSPPVGQATACPETKFSIATGEAGWTGWGVDLANTRFQPGKAAGLDRDKVARLKLK